MRPSLPLTFLRLLLAALTFAATLLTAAPTPVHRFQQPGSDVDLAAAALVQRMTLAEKVGQMTQVDTLALATKEDITRLALGSLLSGGGSDPVDNSPQSWADAFDNYQSYALKTRLAIPLLYGIDAVHGHNNVNGAVIFPHNIGLGATRHPALVERAARVTAREVAGTGLQWDFAPGTIVARDERWGRTYESFGEDPALVAELGAAYTRGLQTGRLADPTAVLACAKHFLGDGGTAGGKDQGDTICGEATLRRLFLPPYRAAIEAGVGSIMVSYSSWNGTKLHAHRYLITDVLKGELGFRGFLVSDWAAIDQLPGDYPTQIATAIGAGLDMIMIPAGPGKPKNYREFIDCLQSLVTEGRVPLSRIDDAVQRILRVKLELALDARPRTDRALTAQIGSGAHRSVARQCVRESLVLLKNERRTLPLAKGLRRLHVAGAAADDLGLQCGGWTIDWQGRPGLALDGATSLLQALRQAMAPGSTVTFDRDGTGSEGADAVLVVAAEPPYAEGKGDRRDLALPAADLQVLRNARAAGAPVVLMLFSGRPIILGEALALCDALVAAWLPGSEGTGLADVLFGDFAPVGQLPMSWPRSTAQIPVNHGDAAYDPLFPLGFGLSYPHRPGAPPANSRDETIDGPVGRPTLAIP